MKLKDTDFITASSYIRTLENKLLKRTKLDNLVAMDSFLDVLKGLSQGNDYSMSSVGSLDQAEECLKEEWKRVINRMYEISPHKEVIELIEAPHQIHAIRYALKTGHTAESMEQLPDELKEIMGKVLESTEDNQKREITLDKLMFEYMRGRAHKIGSSLIIEQIGMQIDFYNIKAMLRAREMQKDIAFLEFCLVEGGNLKRDLFLRCYSLPMSAITTAFTYKYCGKEIKKGLESYEEHHNFSEIEVLLQDALIEHLKKAKLITYGAEIVYAYLTAKENELRQIRLLLTCKAKQISNTILIRKLGESYV